MKYKFRLERFGKARLCPLRGYFKIQVPVKEHYDAMEDQSVHKASRESISSKYGLRKDVADISGFAIHLCEEKQEENKKNQLN